MYRCTTCSTARSPQLDEAIAMLQSVCKSAACFRSGRQHWKPRWTESVELNTSTARLHRTRRHERRRSRLLCPSCNSWCGLGVPFAIESPVQSGLIIASPRCHLLHRYQIHAHVWRLARARASYWLSHSQPSHANDACCMLCLQNRSSSRLQRTTTSLANAIRSAAHGSTL